MRKLLAVVLATALFLVGCGSGDQALNRAMALREKLLASQNCSFDAVITADYGEKIYTFGMNCQVDDLGNLGFTVTAPETISGITGTVSKEGGKLTFDDQALAFEMLADGQVTPVSAPWLFMHTLRSGYLSACTDTGDGLRISIDDSYADDALHLDIWTDGSDTPVRAEILWQGRRIVSLDVRNFSYV